MRQSWARSAIVRLAACGLAAGGSAACGPAAGDDGSTLLVDYASLSGGVVFATGKVSTARGYDLFLVPGPIDQTAGAYPLIQLTEAGGDEWQPSVSPGGNGLAYVRPDEGVFFVSPDGRIRRITDSGGRFRDSIPAVSHDGTFVAWARADTSKPIGDSGLFETAIWIAESDGSNPRALVPKTDVVQDAPRFEPRAGSGLVAWSEFNARNFRTDGIPSSFGLWVHDFRTNIGQFVCQNTELVIDDRPQRCIGLHLAWPRPEVLVVPQSFLEINLDGLSNRFDSVYGELLNSVQGQQTGAPIFGSTAFDYTSFPLSASYLGDRMIFDGLATGVFIGDVDTLSFWVARTDGREAWRLVIEDYSGDFDPRSTAGYLFSVATPQLMP